MRSLIAALCGILSPAPNLAFAFDGGSITGTVTRNESAEPIAGTRVLLLSSAGGVVLSLNEDNDRDDPSPQPQAWAVSSSRTLAVGENATFLETMETGKDGHFTFTDLKPGAYRLVFFADGYVPRDHKRRIAGATGSPIVLTGGESIGPVAIRMTPTGSLEGRVQEIGGEPLSNIPVYLWRYGYASDGRRQVRVTAAALTDDRGAYRFFWIPPGNYHLSSGGPVGDSRAYGTAYWHRGTNAPKFSKPDDAVFAHVLPGSEQVLHLLLPPSQRSLIQFDFAAHFHDLTVTSTQNENSNTDELNLGQMLSKLEFVRASEATTAVRVENADTDALEFERNDVSRDSPTLQGKIATTTGAIRLSAEDLTIVLHHASDDPREFEVDADGTFEIAYGDDPSDSDVIVEGGEYRVAVAGLPRGWYVQTATLDGVDVLSAASAFHQAGMLEIRLSASGGEIEGMVQWQNGTPASDVLVVLVPDRIRTRADLFARTLADSEGRFSMAGIAPGEYAIHTWEELETNAFFDPGLLEQIEVHGTRVSVAESSRQMINLQMIHQEVTP